MNPDTRRRWRWGGFFLLVWPIPTLVYVISRFDLARSLYGEPSELSLLLGCVSCAAIPMFLVGSVVWIIAWREHGRNRKTWDWPGLYTRVRPVLRWGLALALAIFGLFCVHQAMYFAWLTATPVGPTQPVMISFTVSVVLAFASFPAAGLVVYAFRPRGFPPHRCQKCGSDLTGAPSARCPECGGA